MLAAAWLTAAATSFLAVLSVVTAMFAIMAFRKQAKEVSDEAKMLRVQSDQLAEMRKVTESQIEVLSLQAEDLRKPRLTHILRILYRMPVTVPGAISPHAGKFAQLIGPRQGS